ncbi:XRE family transcriptional regulator [Janthinobacterium sp. TND4EL3]|uniref:LexA family transcriptional regulator n=1 Tax=Janthinobacterium sp. TND4EL3 TaxID=1907311 RepID=UPI00097070E2|nr:XRE family transcriptional regulator [Janthinobacterium sp. TND4EL3]
MPALPLSEEQLADAARLKDLFKEWQHSQKEKKLPSSQEAAAGALGFGQSALAQYLNGRIPLNVAAGIKFAQLLGVALSEFSPSLASEAEMVAHAVAPSADDEATMHFPGLRQVTGDDDQAPVMVAIRMVPEHVRAGITGFETDHLFEDGGHLHVPRQWLEENDLSPDQLRAVKIKGQSMVPMMYPGDVAVVNIKDKSRVNGGVFALNYNGESVVKRLKYERREWYLASENPDFRQEPCRTGDCDVIGRVVRFEPRNFKDRL